MAYMLDTGEDQVVKTPQCRKGGKGNKNKENKENKEKSQTSIDRSLNPTFKYP